jgi:NADH-quinone oxidoreductase subunit C
LIPSLEDLEPLTPDQQRVVDLFRSRLGEGVLRERSFRRQLSIWIARDRILDALRFARRRPTSIVSSSPTSAAWTSWETRPKASRDSRSSTTSIASATTGGSSSRPAWNDGQTVPTASVIWPGANYMEREVYDMLGVHFEGHPNLERILTPDGWLGHPLRKDFPTMSDQFPNVEN